MDYEHEFQDYHLKTTTVEVGTISIEGMDKDPVNYFYMTVYMERQSALNVKRDEASRESRMK